MTKIILTILLLVSLLSGFYAFADDCSSPFLEDCGPFHSDQKKAQDCNALGCGW